MYLRLILALVIVALPVFSYVKVEVTEENSESRMVWLREHVDVGLRAGTWDKRFEKISAVRPDLMAIAPVNGETPVSKVFPKLNLRTRGKLVERLASELNRVLGRTYWADVKIKDNELKDQPTLERLKVSLEKMSDVVPAQNLLSSYAQKWAHKSSSKDGPNCFHTSIASIMLGWNKDRYMGQLELPCHIRESFEKIEKPEKWGDMIYYATSTQGPIHAFTFLGEDSQNPENLIVFTKNGYHMSRFLFMTLDSVASMYGAQLKDLEYYRPKGNVVDPSEDQTALCSSEYQQERWNGSRAALEEDPLVRLLK